MTLNGVRLGVDVGKVRIGIAKSDPSGLLASPLTTVKRSKTDQTDIEQIVELIHEYAVKLVYVGNPINLKGETTLSTQDAHNFALQLASRFENVRLVDERFSTVTAQRSLRSTGKTVKSSKAIIDQTAAAVLLQNALEFEMEQGKPAGQLVVDTAQTGDAYDSQG